MTIRVGTDCSGKEALIQALRVNVVKEIIKQIQKTNTKNKYKKQFKTFLFPDQHSTTKTK